METDIQRNDVRPEELYYTRETIMGTEVIKVADTLYPSPDGNDCYHDMKLWDAAQEMCKLN